MQKDKSLYILSKEADADIDAIFDYTVKEFGFNQAVKYVLEFETIFNQLAKHPNLGKLRIEIKKGVWSLPAGEHIVFYAKHNNYIRIVRVLHGRCDLPKQFK